MQRTYRDRPDDVLELLEYGLALPPDEDAIARTRALLEDVRSRFSKAASAVAA